MRHSLALLLIASLCARTVAAQQPAAPQTVLFVGNSFTYGGATAVYKYNASAVINENSDNGKTGGIPGIFKKFADESGLHDEVHFEVSGGKNLRYHYDTALAKIAQPKWDVVVLQGLSAESLPAEREGKPDDFVKYAEQLEKAVHAARANTKMYLYETWPYPFKPYPANAADPAAPLQAMHDDLQAGYQRAFADDKHFEAVIPVGDAWMAAIRSGAATAMPEQPLKPGQIDLWDKDYKHPSLQGSYLAALVLFEKITGSDVRKLGAAEQAAHDLGIPKEDALKLQGIAAETK